MLRNVALVAESAANCLMILFRYFFPILALFAVTPAAADDLALDAWSNCAITKARAYGATHNPKGAAHGILAECATYEVNFLMGLQQAGVREPDFGRQLEAATTKVLDLTISNLGPK